MNTGRKLLVIVSIFTLSLLFFTTSALAQETDPAAPDPEGQTCLEQMQEWMGPEAWAAMIAHMTEVHGEEFTAQMLQRMNEQGDCPGHGFMHNRMGMWGFRTSDAPTGGMWGFRNGDDTPNSGRWSFRGMMRGHHGMGGGMMRGWGR